MQLCWSCCMARQPGAHLGCQSLRTDSLFWHLPQENQAQRPSRSLIPAMLAAASLQLAGPGHWQPGPTPLKVPSRPGDAGWQTAQQGPTALHSKERCQPEPAAFSTTCGLPVRIRPVCQPNGENKLHAPALIHRRPSQRLCDAFNSLHLPSDSDEAPRDKSPTSTCSPAVPTSPILHSAKPTQARCGLVDM